MSDSLSKWRGFIIKVTLGCLQLRTDLNILISFLFFFFRWEWDFCLPPVSRSFLLPIIEAGSGSKVTFGYEGGGGGHTVFWRDTKLSKCEYGVNPKSLQIWNVYEAQGKLANDHGCKLYSFTQNAWCSNIRPGSMSVRRCMLVKAKDVRFPQTQSITLSTTPT